MSSSQSFGAATDPQGDEASRGSERSRGDSAQQDRLPRVARTTAVAGSKKRILLAEDDADMRELLSWALIDGGYEVETVPDGTDLCRRLAKHLAHPATDQIDLVVSDIRMPGVTGLEVIRALRELDNVPPTILITAFGDREIHRQAEEVGALLLDKPFEIDVLLARVREILCS